MTKCYSHSKEGGQYTYCNQLTNLETIVLVIFWVALQFEVAVPQLRTSHMDFTPTNTCPTKNPNKRCSEYVAFECHAKFKINPELFAHRDRRKCPACIRGTVPQ